MPEEISEVKQLIADGTAKNLEQALGILSERQKEREILDLRLFYQNSSLIRQIFPELLDEKQYKGSNVRMASVPSGSLDRALKYEGERKLALGKLMELVSKKAGVTKLTAVIRNFQFGGKKGVFLSSFSEKAVHKRGSKSFAERYGFYRIEFRRVLEDYVLGMFGAWNRHEVSKEASLALYIPKSEIIEL